MTPIHYLLGALCLSFVIGGVLALLWIALGDWQERRDPTDCMPYAPENPEVLLREIAAARCPADLACLISRSMTLPAAAHEECMRLIHLKQIELTQP